MLSPLSLAALQPLRPPTAAELAYTDLVTASPSATAAEATNVFQRYGIVRVPAVLSADQTSELVAEATTLQREQRTAYAQRSRSDRYTLWLADGESSIVPRGGDGVLERTLHGDLAATWQQCASALGNPLVALAEVVTSMPGGAAQAWHQDGAGLTMQIALCKCGLAQGPTEVRPRPFRAEKLLALTRDREEYSAIEPMARALHKLERPIYDGTGRLHAAFWEAIGPRLSREQAALGMSAGVLPPPPSVRLTGEPGDLVLYDGAMQHRGGANQGEYARPILAVHLRDNADYGATRQLPEYT